MGLTAREARAGNITMVLTWTGGSLTFDNTSSTYALSGSSTQSLQVNIPQVNSYLASHGSAITFTGTFGASSNYPGGIPVATQATLNENGTAVLSSATGATDLSITVSQTGFLVPSGPPGTLTSGQGAIFNNMAAGDTQTTNSSYNASDTAPITSTSSGTQLQAFSPTNSLPVATIGSGYALNDTVTINFANSTPGPGTYDIFGVAGTLTSSAIVPEPAGLLLMLTGLPMPLVVMGLLRRRRGAA
jgi:hypothetical protein